MTEGLIEVDSAAFRFCFDLEEIHIPTSVNRISTYITSYSAGIRRIYFEGINTTIEDAARLTNEWNRIVVYVKPESAAEKTAKKYGIRYELF